MKYTINILISILSLIIISCNNNSVEQTEIEESAGITITREQFETANMKLGKPEKMLFPQEIDFTGSVVAKTNGEAKISIPIEGIVSQIIVNEGQNISSGQPLIEITGTALIDLQQAYAESAAKLKLLKTEYKRVEGLYEQNIGTEKEFINAESAFKIGQATNSSLKLKLKQIGLDPMQIENGQFYNTYKINAPITGNVSHIEISEGQFIDQFTTVANIVNPNRLHLKLDVFSSNISKIKIGQEVVFKLDNTLDKATISSVGTSINQNSKAIECFANIDKTSAQKFVHRQQVTGNIIVATDSILAIPETSTIKKDNSSYVLLLVSTKNNIYQFEERLVKVMNTYKNYVAIENLKETDKILIDGAYNLIGE